MTDDRKPDLTGLKARLADIDALAAAGERAQALEARGEVIARLEGVGRPGRLLLAQAVLRQAAALEEAGQSALSLKLLRRVEEEFGDVAAAGKPPVAALAGYRICLYHFKTGRYEEAVAAADRLVEKYLGDDAATYLLAEALLIKSGCFAPGQLDLPERQIESLATLLRHFGESERPRVRFYVPPAMYELGAAFRRRATSTVPSKCGAISSIGSARGPRRMAVSSRSSRRRARSTRWSSWDAPRKRGPPARRYFIVWRNKGTAREPCLSWVRRFFERPVLWSGPGSYERRSRCTPACTMPFLIVGKPKYRSGGYMP